MGPGLHPPSAPPQSLAPAELCPGPFERTGYCAELAEGLGEVLVEAVLGCKKSAAPGRHRSGPPPPRPSGLAGQFPQLPFGDLMAFRPYQAFDQVRSVLKVGGIADAQFTQALGHRFEMLNAVLGVAHSQSQAPQRGSGLRVQLEVVSGVEE